MKILDKIRALPQVKEVWSETGHREDSRLKDWWARLVPGWQYDSLHCLHEDTLIDLLRAAKDCIPCHCGGCKSQLETF